MKIGAIIEWIPILSPMINLPEIRIITFRNIQMIDPIIKMELAMSNHFLLPKLLKGPVRKEEKTAAIGSTVLAKLDSNSRLTPKHLS